MKEKINDDYARQINAYWGRDVVRVEKVTESGHDKKGPWTLTYDAIVSDPWPNGYPS